MLSLFNKDVKNSVRYFLKLSKIELNSNVEAFTTESESAMNNPGYDYQVVTRQCQTCKLDKPLQGFERDMQTEMGFRTWECNDCASERVSDKKTNLKLATNRSGDYLTRKTHTSKPPIESEI